MKAKQILICTFTALLSGFSSAYISGQITISLHTQKCQKQHWALKPICSTWVTPNAIWQGSTTGLWTGTVLGAFVGGLVTRQQNNS
jgi:hypothetical protein